ncbi:hypothetical protein BRADI_3g19665v3 [Brachypodium distachyon]|uniref:Uncharacterized protein n=1 Tax=Brachypodium distachyon TaxID=15368 RepID=A0A0Q3JC42_BRADI|nr:hypothetical protein BRADI_3g19665v3 [Brachypodium distachyon]
MQVLSRANGPDDDKKPVSSWDDYKCPPHAGARTTTSVVVEFFWGGLGTNIGGSHSRDKDLHMDDDEHDMYGNEEESTMATKEMSIIMAMRVLKTMEISKVITKMMIEYACKVKI